jgi:hypothetical protein
MPALDSCCQSTIIKHHRRHLFHPSHLPCRSPKVPNYKHKWTEWLPLARHVSRQETGRRQAVLDSKDPATRKRGSARDISNTKDGFEPFRLHLLTEARPFPMQHPDQATLLVSSPCPPKASLGLAPPMDLSRPFVPRI